MRKTNVIASLGLFAVALSAFAAPPRTATEVTDEVLRKMTICSAPVKITREPFSTALPSGFRTQLIRLESDSHHCANQYAAIVTPSGRFYLGGPWMLTGLKGTPEEKLKAFAWERLHENYSATLDPSKTSDGLIRATLSHRTDYGMVKTEGWIDRAWTIYLPGDFQASSTDLASFRLTKLSNVLSSSPSTGPSLARVSLIEFSDFQCPSCKASATYMKPILQKYKDRIRYVRVDMPLISHHPWAFPAALAGRAIYRQSPEAFWKYKDWVYENQGELNLFSLDDFAMNFVKDHDLDIARYESDISKPALREQLLASVGTGFGIGVMGTPTFLVDGVVIDPGNNGAAIDRYIGEKLGGK